MSNTPAICAFTIDVESFAESLRQSVAVPASLLEPARMDAELDCNLDSCLEFLEQYQVRGTFFFLGRIARSAPQLVQRVAAAGHEIGCHSLQHVRISGQTREEFRSDLRAAREALEDVSGRPVIGFRAPDFSIGRNNLWALDELAEAGFRYDSSVVPTRIHDVYGLVGTSKGLFRWPNGIVEFPLPVATILGVGIPIGGGGYFRLFPSGWTRRVFEGRQRRHVPTAFYIHPYEIGTATPRLPDLSMTRRFRHYVRLTQGRKRLAQMMRDIQFTTMADVLMHSGMIAVNSRGTHGATATIHR
jgi:polysaccharide deacetylase family protein (PEP-CTERM system associated)